MDRGDICEAPKDLQRRSHPSFWKRCVRRPVPRGCSPAGMCVCTGACALVSLDVSVWVSRLQRRLIRPWEYPMWQHIRTSLSCFWRPPTHYCNTRTVHSACSGSLCISRRTLRQHKFGASARRARKKKKKKEKQIQKKVLMSLENNDSKRSLRHYDEIMAGGEQPRPMTLAIWGMEAAESVIIVPHSIKNS